MHCIRSSNNKSALKKCILLDNFFLYLQYMKINTYVHVDYTVLTCLHIFFHFTLLFLFCFAVNWQIEIPISAIKLNLMRQKDQRQWHFSYFFTIFLLEFRILLIFFNVTHFIKFNWCNYFKQKVVCSNQQIQRMDT